jgi:V-type H+-transporting ATPase subunit a
MNIITEFVPQLLFLHSIFGYLVICIIYKWLVDWSKSPTQPPNLLNMLISMFLSPGTVEDPLYAGQAAVQVGLLLLALVCVPWMLCAKPYLLWQERKKREAEGYRALGEGAASTDGRRYSDDDADGEERADPSAHHGEEVRFVWYYYL